MHKKPHQPSPWIEYFRVLKLSWIQMHCRDIGDDRATTGNDISCGDLI
ncbi:hypothetical protein DsansV1_C29g0209201 [Dioscorea sansibarensis]